MPVEDCGCEFGDPSDEGTAQVIKRCDKHTKEHNAYWQITHPTPVTDLVLMQIDTENRTLRDLCDRMAHWIAEELRACDTEGEHVSFGYPSTKQAREAVTQWASLKRPIVNPEVVQSTCARCGLPLVNGRCTFLDCWSNLICSTPPTSSP